MRPDGPPPDFAAWQRLAAPAAAAGLARRLAALPAAQRRAAVARLRPAADLAGDLADRVAPGAPLAGVPYFTKDLFAVAGMPTEAGSTFLSRVRPVTGDGRLTRALASAGAVLAGKTHLHEFALGLSGENPHWGGCSHPFFPERTTGGSSSGSAALVAAGVVPLATGTDTGGSIRVPAAFCGIFGYRGVPGEPLIADAMPLAPSLDTAGWFTRTPGDLQRVLRALVPPTAGPGAPRGLWLELEGVDAGVAAACRAAGAVLEPVHDASAAGELRAAFRDCAASYLAISGVEAWEVHRPWAEAHRADYDPVVWERLVGGRDVPPAALTAARGRRTAVREAFARYFSRYDFLALPAAPSVAPLRAEFTADLRRRILALTAPASLAGLPALTLPVALPGGLSAGVQFLVPTPGSPACDWALQRWQQAP